MCKVETISIQGRKVKVAEIKKRYLHNIADAAKDCAPISRVILFGSSTSSRCKDSSDIDIAVFGSLTKGKMQLSKSYRRFADRLASYDDYSQTYDILYYKDGDNGHDAILDEIAQGQLIYERQ